MVIIVPQVGLATELTRKLKEIKKKTRVWTGQKQSNYDCQHFLKKMENFI